MIRNLRRLILSLVLVLCVCAAFGRTYLVAVGVSDYPGTHMDLTLPVNDARSIAGIYHRNSRADIVMLLDSAASTKVLKDTMTSLFSRASIDDRVVFFFSGHGFQGGFRTYDGFLSYDAIRHIMAGSNARTKMIFADACYAGQLREPSTVLPASSNTGKDSIGTNVMLFLSSRSGEVSRERGDMKNGYFTTFLERALRGKADKNRDRVITAKELFQYVNTKVAEISHGLQHPVMWGKFPDDMAVMEW